MPPFALALALALASQAPAENPADLAGRLASPDPAAREEAEGRLEELGAAALPTLRLALTKAEDSAVSRRLADVIDLIERRRLLRATPVALELKSAPLADAVAELSRRSGLLAVLDPPNDPVWASARVTFATRGPVGFWEALDRLGTAGGFRAEVGTFWSLAPQDVPAVRLVRGEALAIRPSYAGPYRVELTSLHRHRRVTRPKEGRAAKVVDEFTATLQLAAEPGLHVDRNGSPRVLEAVDDRGGDLRPASTRDPSWRMGLPFRQWRPEVEAETYRIPLAIPAARGGMLARFRGVLPVVAYARTEPLMTVPIAGIEGRALAASGVVLTVRKFARVNTRAWALQAVVHGEAQPTGTATAAGPRQLTLSPLKPPFQADDHIQVVDDQNRPFLMNSGSTPRPDGSIEINIQLHTNPLYGPPTTLRYYGLVAEATEVPFAFEGVPMP
jgi:hypothetical protein